MSIEVTLMVSTEGLTALADMALTTKDQSKLDELLSRNSAGVIKETARESFPQTSCSNLICCSKKLMH